MEHGQREEQPIGDNEDERQLLLPRQQPTKTGSLRLGRELQEAGKLTKFVHCVFKFFFGSLGLWGNQAWNYIPRVAVSVICIYQAVYDFYVVVGCPGFDCGFLQNSTDKNHSHHKDDRQIANTVYTIASVGAVLSYSLFICCFMRAKRKDCALVPPVDNMADDLHEKDAWKLCLYFSFISAFYLCSVVVFYAIVWGQKRGTFFDILTTGVAAQFFAQWTAITTCHVFAVSAYSLGTFAKDAHRQIQNLQNGTLDDIIRIHENLCTVVFNTVSVYKLWFVLHWTTYGADVILSVIYLSMEFHSRTKYDTPVLNLIYVCLFFVCHLYLFLVPCIFAARITSCCTSVYEKINFTTSADWDEGHPFQDRRVLALFISYAKDRQCGFKIGRIRFNTSLAWLSFFFGLTGLLYHFLQ